MDKYIVPPYIKVFVHKTPINSISWDPYEVEGWCMALIMKDYRCFKWVINKVGSERMTETSQFFPQQVIIL